MRFTDAKIRNLKPGSDRCEFWEGRGFGVRVSSTGRRTWVFLYRFDGVRRRMTLGVYPAVTLADAREKHVDAERLLLQGIDPATAQREKIRGARIARLEAARKEREAETIDQVVDLYLERYAAGKVSAEDQKRLLYKEVLGTLPIEKAIDEVEGNRHGRKPTPRKPIWTGRKAKDISRRDVIELLEAIIRRGRPSIANRVRATLITLFDWAVRSDILPTTPCVILPHKPKETPRDRVLSEGELRSLMQYLRQAESDPAALALELILTTAQRPGEVIGLPWSEIDLEAKVWTIPAERAKNRLSHRVPLSPAALLILSKARFTGGASRWVFPSPKKKDGPMDRCVLSHWTRRNLEAIGIDPFTPHDCRRTAASHMTAAGIPRLVVAKILNHAERGVTAVYDRFSYDGPKREALEKWSRTLEGIAKKERRA